MPEKIYEFQTTHGILKVRGDFIPFLTAMEEKLELRDAQYGDSWKNCTIKFLNDKLIEEVKEYFDDGRPLEVIDIAAVCAMLYIRWLERQAKKLPEGLDGK